MTDKQVTLHGHPIKVGDRVWHLLYGWSTVKAIRHGIEYPIVVSGIGTFISDGRGLYTHRNPTLFWNEINIDPPPPPKHEIDWTKVPWGTRIRSKSGTVAVFFRYSVDDEKIAIFEQGGLFPRFVSGDNWEIDGEVKEEWLK